MLENIEVLYHSSIRINKEKIIYIDPFKINKNYNDADIIFITHDHYDHYSEEDIDKVINENTTIIIPDELLTKLLRKGMPDSSIMLDLCNELKISVNELLCGELIEMNNYNEFAEKTLLEMAQKEEMQNKKLMMYENVIGFSSAISFLILIFVTSFLAENNIAKIVLFILAFILLIIGVSVALKIETETGYYECQKCHYKYVPKYSQVYFAMHSGTTRYMKCPKCNKKSWQRKTLSK